MPDLNSVIRYFDLQSSVRKLAPKSHGLEAEKPFPVLPQYCALVAGVAVQPFLSAFQKTHEWNLSGWQGWIVFSVLVGLIIFPAIYKKSFDPGRNLFVQLCAIFASGLGWQSLMQTAATAAKLTQ